MHRNIVPFSPQVQQAAHAADFDESVFAPDDAVFDEYAQDVKAGYRALADRRVVLAGLARDVGDVLPQTIARIERQGEFFADYRVVIYENDSQDDTLQQLRRWAQRNGRVQVVSERRDDPVNQPTRCLSRAERMAYYRSQCQATIGQEYANYDNVVLIDTDLAGGWSYDGMAHTFSRGGWDFVGANGIIYRRLGLRPNAVVQYDAWAYRIDKEFTPLETKTVNYMLYDRGQPFQAVYSCFGGIGVYSMKPYLSGEYDGSDVEHVSFHRDLYQKGFRQIFMNPNLIAVYGRKNRTLDGYMSRVIRMIDSLTGRPATEWQFGDGQSSDDREQRSNQAA